MFQNPKILLKALCLLGMVLWTGLCVTAAMMGWWDGGVVMTPELVRQADESLIIGKFLQYGLVWMPGMLALRLVWMFSTDKPRR